MGLERLVPDLEGIRILSLGQRKRLKVLQQVTISDVALGRSLCLLGGRVPVLSLSCSLRFSVAIENKNEVPMRTAKCPQSQIEISARSGCVACFYFYDIGNNL